MHNLEFDAEYMNDWIKHLRQFGVYFNEPLDLDMSLLQAFPDEYKQLPPGARGPRRDADEARWAVLGSNGDPDLCRDLQDDDYHWYRYLFMTRSKPATHLYALSLIDDVDLCQRAPDAISALLTHVNKTITPPKAR
jgi:putative ATP-dependent endonuclease of OLD family